jgi:hypothetical protein
MITNILTLLPLKPISETPEVVTKNFSFEYAIS